MSGILKFIESVCVQTAVYWSPGTPNAFGQRTFPIPVEIAVRWDDIVEVISDGKGKELVSKAQIMTPGELKEQGYVMLGSVIDLTLADKLDTPPVDFPDAYEIKRVDKTPLFRSKDIFVYTVYL